ncbi:MAG: APC family permease [Gemmatimonadota bacterium]
MTQLQKSLGPVQFFSVGFGSIVGVGWIVLMGSWLSQAGPVGTAVAFLAGGLLLTSVGVCYAEIMTMNPVAGGEAAFAYDVFGSRLAFMVGWIMTLFCIVVVPYISISLAWLLDLLIPGFAGPVLYRWGGGPIYAGSLVISLLWTLWLALVNYRGIRSAAKFQDLLTYGKLAISVVFFGAGLFAGKVANLQPVFSTPTGTPIWGGVIAVLAVTPWFFGGFNFIPQVMEEKAPGTPISLVGRLVVVALLTGAAYYALAAIVTGFAVPWQEVAGKEMAPAAALRMAYGNELFARLVLIAGVCGIITVGNGASIAATRLLFALSRARLISPPFDRLHPKHGSPVVAIGFVMSFAAAAALLGRNGIVPIVNVGSTCSAFAYLVTCLAVLRLRRREPDRPRPYRAPAGTVVATLGAVASALLLASSLYAQYTGAEGGFPLEWAVLLVWGVFGLALWRQGRAVREATSEAERRKVMLGS